MWRVFFCTSLWSFGPIVEPLKVSAKRFMMAMPTKTTHKNFKTCGSLFSCDAHRETPLRRHNCWNFYSFISTLFESEPLAQAIERFPALNSVDGAIGLLKVIFRSSSACQAYCHALTSYYTLLFKIYWRLDYWLLIGETFLSELIVVHGSYHLSQYWRWRNPRITSTYWSSIQTSRNLLPTTAVKTYFICLLQCCS